MIGPELVFNGHKGVPKRMYIALTYRVWEIRIEKKIPFNVVKEAVICNTIQCICGAEPRKNKNIGICD
jgi:hypothetical protein